MSKYADIIERLGNAEDFDRDLDRDIGLTLMGWRYEDVEGFGQMIYIPDENAYYPDHPGSLTPSITASIDAAIALVKRLLPGWRVENLCEWENETLRNRGAWTCDLRENGHEFFSGGRGKCPHAQTPALALLIALLRALEAKEAL